MVDTLEIGIALDLTTCVFFLYISYRVAQLSMDDHPMARYLAWSQWFWLGTAAFMLLDGGFALWILASSPEPPVPLLVQGVRRGLIILGLASLTHLLLRMSHSMRHWTPYFLGYWAILLLGVEAVTLYANPISYLSDTWSIAIVPSRTTPQLLNFASGVLLFAPLIVASLLAMRLYGRLPNREARFRLMALCLGVQSFAAGIIIGFWDNDWFWYGLFENRLAFSVATGMLFALRPPWFVRKYWHVPRLGSAANFPGMHLMSRK